MNAFRSALDRAVPNPRYPGWSVAGMGLLCATLSSPGQSFALSFYLDPLMAETGVGRLAISSLYSAVTLAAALTLPFVGNRADGTSGGRYLGTVLLLMAAAMLLLAFTTSVWMLVPALFALRLLGQGAIGIGILTMTVRWFDRHRGRAFAIVALGYAIGEVIFPTTILRLFEVIGWRGSLFAFAGVYAVVFAPLLFRYARDPVGSDTALETTSQDEAAQASYPLRTALRTPVFYGMSAVLTLSPLIITAVIFHQVALFESIGHGAAGAARAMAGFGIAAVAGTYLAGFLVDRMPERFAIAAALLPLAAGLTLLAWAPQWSLAPFLYGGLLGVANGALKIAGGLVWAAYYGSAHVGAIKGAVASLTNGVTALGPPLAAIIAGPTDQFANMLLPFAGVTAVGAVFVLFLAPPQRLAAESSPVSPGREAA